MRPLLLAACMVFTATGAALAQDPAKAHSAQYRVVLDNAEVRVLHVMVKPGEKNAMHEHPDHLAVMLTDSTVRFAMPDGTSSDLDGKVGEEAREAGGIWAEGVGALREVFRSTTIADIASREALPVSMMPPGLDSMLTAEEVRDLIAFLREKRE